MSRRERDEPGQQGMHMASQSKKASTGVRPRQGRKKTDAAARPENAKRKTASPEQTTGNADRVVSAAQRLGDAIALQSLLAKSFARPQPADSAETEFEERPDALRQEPVEPPAPEPAADSSGRDRLGGRFVKSLLGLLLLVAAVWIPTQRLFQVASVEAVVNAPLVTLRAPIEGEVARGGAALGIGEAIGADAVLIEIVNPRADPGRLNAATRAVADSLDQQTGLASRIEDLSSQQIALERQLEAFRQARIALLEARLETGGAASSTAFKANDELRIELEALRRGVFIGDSYNDKPSSGQRLDAIEIELGALQSQLAVTEARHARLVAAEARERRLFEAQSTAVVMAPAEGRIWEVLTAPGEHVVIGQELVRVLDCSRPLVTAAVSENVYNRLAPGMAAEFSYREGGEPLEGRVVQLTGVASAPANLAIAPSALQRESYRVTVAVPALANGNGCAFGRTGRVVFNPGSTPG